VGIAGGLGQLLGGWLVELTSGLSGQPWFLKAGDYTLLFVAGITLPLVGLLIFRRVQADSSVTTRQFAGMFLRGNPFLALESLVRYHRARDERQIVAMTERLGSTRSPLTVEELLEALHDPRFFVRFEAIVSMARRSPDPQLTEALIETLQGNEPALSTLAAWALGRIGDERALEALRSGLSARYRSVQAHCARSLGNLGDRTVLPTLLSRLETEEDIGVRMALASAVGQLGAVDAVDRLLALLREARSGDERSEYSLALARLSGEEYPFIQLQRRIDAEPGTALSQAVSALRGKLARSSESDPEIEDRLDAAAELLAHEDLRQGVDLLTGALRMLPAGRLVGPCGTVLQECTARLEELGMERIEYVLLALHTLECWLPAKGESQAL
jgi:hypothetical protein